MKNVLKSLLLMVMLFAGSRAAMAAGLNGSISFGGGAVTTPGTGIMFNNPVYSTFGGFQDLSGFMAPKSAAFTSNFNFADIALLSMNGGQGETLLTMVNNAGTQSLQFDVSSFTSSVDGAGFNIYVFTGTLTLYSYSNGQITGVITKQAATFMFSQSANNTFSGALMLTPTAVVTPEPSSLLLLGTGLVSAAGMMIRKRRAVAAV